MLLSLVTLLSGCAETEPTDPNQLLLANKDWYTDGLYDGTGTKVLAPNLRFRFKKTSTINTSTVNGQDLGAAAVWILSADAKTLTIYYPTIASGGVSVASQVLKVVKLTANELWVTAPGTDDIQLFGIINLSSTSNYRFTTTAPSTVTPIAEEAILKSATWTGTNTTQTAGVFTSTGGAPYVWTNYAPVTFKFNTFYGLNYVTVSNLPTPATWMLKSATELTIAYPKVGLVPAKAFTLTISEITASKLKFSATEALTFSSVFTMNAGAQLHLVPQP